MSTMLVRAFTGTLLLAAMATGCSDNGSGASGSAVEPKATTSSSPRPVAGAVGSEECSLKRRQLSLVVRDWGRVYGSISRGDHSTYTGAFVARLGTIQKDAAGCNGSIALGRFQQAARRIDVDSSRPSPGYPLYDEAIAQGNAWLKELGYGINALSVD